MTSIHRTASLITLCLVLGASACTWRSRTFKRLEQDIAEPLEVVTLDKSMKYYFFSDLHRGDGGSLDYFNPNRKIFSSILRDLYEGGEDEKPAVLVMVGDVEELWAYGFSLKHGKRTSKPAEYADQLLSPKNGENQGIFDWEVKFREAGRYHRLYGNHDDYWKKPENLKGTLLEGHDIPVRSAIALRFEDDERYAIIVTHGCQGQPEHDIDSMIAPIAKQIELHTWYYLRRIFLKHGERLRPKTLTKTRDRFKKQEKYLREWAKEHDLILIVGHSHEPYVDGEAQDCILQREITHIRSKELPLLEKRIKDLETEITDLSLKTDARSRSRNRDLAEQRRIEEIERANREVELRFLQDELQGRMRMRIRGTAEREPGGGGFYFNAGCGFASNMITAVELAHRDEEWHARLVCWDIKEGRFIDKDDTPAIVGDKIYMRGLTGLIPLKAPSKR